MRRLERLRVDGTLGHASGAVVRPAGQRPGDGGRFAGTGASASLGTHSRVDSGGSVIVAATAAVNGSGPACFGIIKPGLRSPSAAAPTVGAGISNPAFIEERAHHAYETGRLDVAEGYYLQLVRLKPKDSGPWFQLGNLYSEQGRLDAAERAYRESLRRRDDARTLHNLDSRK